MFVVGSVKLLAEFIGGFPKVGIEFVEKGLLSS